jgi:hypothetical protein
MTSHRLPDGTILELRPGQTITQEELDALAADLPTYRRAERERRAAMTPREWADEPKAWLAAVERGVRARG